MNQPVSKVKEISKDDFMKALSKWKRCYIKKPKSWQKVWMWWERDKSDPKEQWFMNIARSTRTGIENSVWITAKDIEHWIGYMEREGYKYHIDE
jgi:hypothetical protein